MNKVPPLGHKQKKKLRQVFHKLKVYKRPSSVGLPLVYYGLKIVLQMSIFRVSPLGLLLLRPQMNKRNSTGLKQTEDLVHLFQDKSLQKAADFYSSFFSESVLPARYLRQDRKTDYIIQVFYRAFIDGRTCSCLLLKTGFPQLFFKLRQRDDLLQDFCRPKTFFRISTDISPYRHQSYIKRELCPQFRVSSRGFRIFQRQSTFLRAFGEIGLA